MHELRGADIISPHSFSQAIHWTGEDDRHGLYDEALEEAETIIEDMYAHRYESPRDNFPRGPAYMRHVLGTLKDARPDLFRQEVRVSSFTFDKLVQNLEQEQGRVDPILFRDADQRNIPVSSPLIGSHTRYVIHGGEFLESVVPPAFTSRDTIRA
ncbi:hypothetical protein B0H11DRAFT_1933531 [Mycena galericulata]|nr:hypothetical protein B0H11DRAFT_1933531 [Mycena galericulata]